MRQQLKQELKDQFSSREMRFAPIRSLNDFILDATWNIPDFSDLTRLNNRIVSNLVYYQTNYFAFGIVLFLLVGINYPVDFLFGLTVVSALLMAFVYISSSARVGNSTLASIEHFLRQAKEDRPIIILIAILGLAYFVLSFMGKLFIFLLGIVLPIQAIILHATLRRRNLANKVTNQLDKINMQYTPMGIFLSALGLRSSSLLE